MTRAQMVKRLAEAGLTVEENLFRDSTIDIMVDTPDGFVFKGTGLHCHVTHWLSDRAAARDAAVADALGSLPLVPCPAGKDCDVCGSSEEADNGTE